MSQPSLKTNAIHVFPNIWQSKNKTVELGQLTECNKRNIFLQKIMQKVMQGDQFQTSYF